MFIRPQTPRSHTQTTISSFQTAQLFLDSRRIITSSNTVDNPLRNLGSRDGWETWEALGGWWVFCLFALLLFAFTAICLCVLAISFHRRINFPDEMLSQLLTNPQNELPSDRGMNGSQRRELQRRRNIFSQRLRYCTF